MTKKYWYKCIIYYCPICFREQEDRFRVYKKPKDYWRWEQDYDYCLR